MAGRLSRELFTLYKTAADTRSIPPSMQRAILGGAAGSAVGLAGASGFPFLQKGPQYEEAYAPIGRELPLPSAVDNASIWADPTERRIMSNTAWPMGTRRKVLAHFQKNVKPKWTERLTGGYSGPVGTFTYKNALQKRLRPGQIQGDALEPKGRLTLLPDPYNKNQLLREHWK